jgi:small redox-active disulfide protein 2
MINIKILGTGCASCKATQKLVEDVIKAKGVQAQVEKVEDIASIMKYGVMSTPGIVIDGKVVHAGGIPSRAHIEQWIDA